MNGYPYGAMLSKKELKIRRNRLLEKLGGGSAAIIFSADDCICGGGGGVLHPYYQNSDFYYLTGLVEQGSVGLFLPQRGDGEFVLFTRRKNPHKERWFGPYIGQDGACSEFGADQAFPTEDIAKIAPKLLVGRENIYSNIGPNNPRHKNVKYWLRKANISPKLNFIGKVLHDMRLKKSADEISIIRRGVEITSEGYFRAMEKCKPGMYEFELEAELMREFIRLGGKYPDFAVIVASGVNACTLHYSRNDKKMVAGELVLVDSGVKYQHYCTDVSRTFPVSGKFSTRQRAIYKIVLETQKRVISEIRPGVSWGHLQSTADRFITEGLVDVGILNGNIETLLARGDFKQFFMHRIGHWLGLDSHDVGDYSIGGKSRILKPNMVLTVEPGIYISPDIPNIDDRWRGIGIRVEDDVLVKETGCEILTKDIPCEIEDLERLVCF